MPTEVAEGMSGIKKVSPLVGFVHKRRALVPVIPRGRQQKLHRPPLERSVVSRLGVVEVLPEVVSS